MANIIKKGILSKGLRLPENKISESIPIRKLAIPEKVLILLQQHFGEPCNPIVARGDKVKTGQIIADSEKLFSSPLHSTISGTVTSVTKTLNPFANNIVSAVEITGDGEDNWIDLKPEPGVKNICDKLNEIYSDCLDKTQGKPLDLNESKGNSGELKNLWDMLKKAIEEIPNEELIKRIKNAGIVGLGGATFPTHVKLATTKKIDTLILNGCECEPFITADHRIMLEYGWQVLAGAYIIFKVISPEFVYIAIEDNKRDAIALFAKLIEDSGLGQKFRVVSLKSRYPMGAEKILIKNVIGKKVPVGKLPMDIGVVVNNVGTSKAVFDSLSTGTPLVEKVVTVTGDVEKPQNFLVRIGTPVKDMLSCCGELNTGKTKIIMGGPMMGNAIADLSFPITKAVSCILLKHFENIQEGNCIRCGRCVNICPMNLMPLIYAAYAKNSKYEVLPDYHINTCIECGSCAYVCPAGIPIVAYIKTAKSVLVGYGK
ncbi:MAG: electron transport complex subunit RsxC [Actinomycetota bacterium]|nr:electron transport complex subunit RsxC [Actinomycetota bacterium]